MQVPVEVLSTDDVARLLGQPERTDVLGMRDAAVLATLYYAAATAHELTELDVAHVRPGRRHLTLVGDEGVRRRVKLEAPLREALKEYAERARPLMLAHAHAGDQVEAFFLANKPHRLRVQDVRQILGANVKAAGIDGHVNLNTLRLSRAWHLREEGVAPDAIQRFLGTPSRSGRRVI